MIPLPSTTARQYQVNEAQDLLIDIGASDEKIAQLKVLLGDLEHAKSVMDARESTGFSSPFEIGQIDQNIQDIKAELLGLQGKKENATVALNVLIGQSNTNLHHAISASLPWGKQFSMIDEQTENEMRARLTGTNSPNSRF